MSEQTNNDWLSDPAPPPAPASGKPAHKKPASRRKRANAAVAPAIIPAGLDALPVEAGPQPGERPDPPEEKPKAPPSGGKPGRPQGEIFDGCPVRPLGVNGGASYYLDVHGQMRAVTKHDAQSIMQLFGSQIPKLCYHFAQWTKDPHTEEMKRKPHRFDQTTAAMDMIAACSEKGLFDPDGAVRGVGAWSDDDGQLIYHTGDKLLRGDHAEVLGTHQGRIYPAYPPIPHPAPSEKLTDPVPKLLETLNTWKWQRPEIDAMIALGMIGVQMLGGALDWRPVFWLTGGKAAGKSQFQTLIKHLHGEKGLIQSNDATKSGLTSRIGHSSLPVALDELEPGDEGSSKEKDIITLARVAASGGQWYRGSSDQKGAGGNVYSSFLFSSILIPGSMKSQDLSRLIVLSLNAIPDGTPPLVLRADDWRKRGAALKRLLVDRWPSWAARLDLWRTAFAEEGLSGRNGDNWATTLAMADMARQEALPQPEELQSWAKRVASLVRADTEEIGSDADSMLLHLLSQSFDIYRRGEQHTVAQWLMVAAQLPGAPPALMGSDTPDHPEDRAKMANAKLAKAGLRVTGVREEAELFIANAPIQGLKDLFRTSEWANGVWKQSAVRVAKARCSTSSRTLAGITTRGTEIPFASIPGLAFFPQDRVKPPVVTEPTSGPNEMDEFA
ncbi:MAG: hypothetical protein DI533_04625 [Cereibacter sphaeroides]|uniref:Uncharacterized protein n=1 Tax=Cereibacter sphaeroides TaxID=1063 RepID=A0A2W5UQ60_CERSP|nr:MAG: hypothetical protein DI533_04625 [Cereibacter sphaeroides]